MPNLRYVGIGQVCRDTGISPRQMRHWINSGVISGYKDETTHPGEYRVVESEIPVIKIMLRILDANLRELASVREIADKHLRDVDVLRTMGYDGDSIVTEHTIGHGLVISVT